MRIVRFNGLGEPSPTVADGCIMLLVQGSNVSVARLELLPADHLGPLLERALNSDALAPDARAAVQQAFPDGLSPDRDWTLECPPELVLRATFRSVDIRFENLFCPRDGEPDGYGPLEFPPGPDPDGSSDLLGILDGEPNHYVRFASEYYERELQKTDVAAVYAHAPLTQELVERLNPEVSLESLSDDLMQIGYPA